MLLQRNNFLFEPFDGFLSVASETKKISPGASNPAFSNYTSSNAFHIQNSCAIDCAIYFTPETMPPSSVYIISMLALETMA